MSFTLAHLSDLHITPVRFQHLPLRLNKQTLGWVKWSLRRCKEHRPEVLDALIADLHAQHPDHVAVTGDVTNVGQKNEILSALPWLQRLGNRQHVSLVPGNHDTYADASPHEIWQYWESYLRSDFDDWPNLKALVETPSSDTNNENEPDTLAAAFPTLRIRGSMALIGLCSAQPTNLFHATGYVDAAQRARLAHLLRALADTPLCCVVLIHHPPTQVGLSPRRHLRDASRLQDVLAAGGVDLVLHGHTHETTLSHIQPSGQPGYPEQHNTAIPVVGVRSASARSDKPKRLAQYHLYNIELLSQTGQKTSFRISVIIRGYNKHSRRFQSLGHYNLGPGDGPLDDPRDQAAEKTRSQRLYSISLRRKKKNNAGSKARGNGG